ncbi:MAG TPA: LCP family protein [Micromonosporaceae bacterium]
MRERGRPPRRKPKSPLWAKLTVAFGALVMLGSGLSVAVPKLAAWWALDKVEQISGIPDELRGQTLTGDVNFLLLGLDQSLNSTIKTSPRSDSIVLVHIPASHKQVYMISLPRDLLVPVMPAMPEVGFKHDYTSDEYPMKLTEAFYVGARSADPQYADVNWDSRPRDVSKEALERGIGETTKVISELVPGGLKFHGSAIIDFTGFDKVVEAIGGVHMCVDFNGKVVKDSNGQTPDGIWSIHRYANGKLLPQSMSRTAQNYGSSAERATRSQRAHYTEGCQDLKPWQALDLSRQRDQYTNTDYGRQAMQQQLLMAIVKKVASPDTLTNFKTIGKLQQAAGNLLKLDLGGHAVEDWVLTLKDLRPNDMTPISTYGSGDASFHFPSVTLVRGGVPLSFQRVEPELVQLLTAVKNDTVDAFLAQHPTWVAKNAQSTGEPTTGPTTTP